MRKLPEPGIQQQRGGVSVPKMVRTMLINRSAPQPTSRKTPRGGRITAKMNLQMSLSKQAVLVRGYCSDEAVVAVLPWRSAPATTEALGELLLQLQIGKSLPGGERHDGGLRIAGILGAVFKLLWMRRLVMMVQRL